MTEHRMTLTALAESLKNGGHSIFSASGSGLWFNCAGGLLPNLLAPDRSGYEAAEGTVAHGCGELWLRSKVRPDHLVGTVQAIEEGENKYEVEITDQMLDYVEFYFDWCSVLPGKHFIETKVYYSQITPIPHQGGTADHVACSWQRMVITDLKYGKGVFVGIMDNTQALLYALGFFYEWDWCYDFQEIELRICQPRMENMSTWIITREELLAFAEEAKVRAHLAWSFNAPRTPGEKQCSFCKVKNDCGAHFTMQAALTAGVFTNVEEEVTGEEVTALKELIDEESFSPRMLKVNSLETRHLAKLFGYRSMFESWWKSVHIELMRRAAAGESVPELKVVEGRSKRKIKDVDTALFMLDLEYGLTVDELMPRKFVGPTTLDAMLLKHGVRRRDLQKALEGLVYKPPGKPTLVPLSDRRLPMVDITEDVFTALESETPEDETQED